MGKAFQRLCELTADAVDTTRVKNHRLRRIFAEVIGEEGDGFIFWKRRRMYTEHSRQYMDDDLNHMETYDIADHDQHSRYTEHSEYNDGHLDFYD
ncbi:hypothetical protein HOD38_00555 [archaeon]|jgi:hypothetical protein|nr:hypothetical protein [archaeon]MBT4396737.1 hypothetical protein [archaeon]MBT4441347.1 hypothetical protein [archaeon]